MVRFDACNQVEGRANGAFVAASSHSDTQHQELWVNINAWTATLVASLHAKARDKPDLSLFGIWSVRSALEEQEKPPNVAVNAAAVWFEYAAGAIRDFCQKDKSFDSKVAAPGSLFKEHS